MADRSMQSNSLAPAVGVFGGTFDPPHLGHLILAEAVCDVLGLEQVLFVLAADPPHKQGMSLTAASHRLAMLERAIVGNPRFVLSDVDIARPGPHYTVDTLRPEVQIDLAALDDKVPGLAARSVLVNAPEIGISGTLLRERLHANLSIRYLVPDAVEQYIAENALYRNSDHVQESS